MGTTPEPRRGLGVVTSVLKTLLERGALASFRHPLLAIVAVVFFGALGTWATSRLRLDPDITQLLPPSYASVQGVEKLRERFGGVGNVVLLVEGGDAAARRRFADDMAPRLERLETVQFVDHRFPGEFFEDRALYFMEQADLEALRDRLDARRRWEIERSMVDLDDEPPPSVDMSDLESKYRRRLDSTGASRRGAYYEDEAGKTLAVFVRPTHLASDLDFSRRVVADVQRVLAEAQLTTYAPDLRVQLTGRYPKRVDLQALLSGDLALTSVLATSLIVAWVALHFRRVLAVVLVLTPLYVGLTLAYGVASALFGTLNILTAFIGAILLGIGIDHGIHLLGRYEEERRGGASDEEAIRLSFGEAGRVSLAAGLTTAAAFFCLTWTDFRAFREFGLLAGAGTMLVLIAYVTALPALLGMLARFAPRLSSASKGISLPGVRGMRRAAPVLFCGLGALGLVAVTQIPRAHFDADFSRLDDADLPSFRRDKEVNAMLGRSQTPLVVLADDEVEARQVSEVLRAQMEARGSDATVGTIATRGDLLPSDQEAKRPVLQDIERIAARFEGAKLTEADRDRLARLRRMASALPFGAAELPPSLRHAFEPRAGTGPAHFVLLYPTVSMGEAAAVKRLASQLRAITLPSGKVVAAAGEPMVMADVLDAVERDAPRIFVLTGAFVFFTLLFTLGKLRLALLALAPAVVTLTVTVGLLPLFGLDINYLNMIILPILLGIGVDDGAHLVARIDAGEPLGEVWRHTGWDITGAILTDVFGFGVLALASHPGLASLGYLSLLGLSVNMVACVVFLPAGLELLSRLRSRRAGVPLAVEGPVEPPAAPDRLSGTPPSRH
ncbi:efflux RND transporter permease subunit [Chondromyces apiculatus]|uniref:SSD domain-containing protein n=1 Tax=Chondromyces apiculatus DSM 436 TaxID=1192034 RepID=A0A017T9W1_9BACT|nr:MMPL family transporter [Chondromyces apiculatus]EYF05595.1 Hypothetical protein CAP_3143 [Chondromyces apiculatus DSM 436]